MSDERSTPYYVGFYFRDDEDETLAVNKGNISFAIAAIDPIEEPIGKVVHYNNGTARTPVQTSVKWEIDFIAFENNLKYNNDPILPSIEQIPWLQYVLRSKFLQIQGTDFPSVAKDEVVQVPYFPVYFNRYILPRRVYWDSDKITRTLDYETGRIRYKLTFRDYHPSYDPNPPTPWSLWDWWDQTNNVTPALNAMGA